MGGRHARCTVTPGLVFFGPGFCFRVDNALVGLELEAAQHTGAIGTDLAVREFDVHQSFRPTDGHFAVTSIEPEHRNNGSNPRTRTSRRTYRASNERFRMSFSSPFGVSARAGLEPVRKEKQPIHCLISCGPKVRNFGFCVSAGMSHIFANMTRFSVMYAVTSASISASAALKCF